MIFDELGLPRDTGATDFQDSARLAGIMTVFGWPQRVELNKYVVGTSKMVYMRHPAEYKYDFSRDQAICLMAGLFVQDAKILVSKHPGLSKREYIAAMALQGYVAASEQMDEFAEGWEKFIAKHSVILADALIEALNKEAKDEL